MHIFVNSIFDEYIQLTLTLGDKERTKKCCGKIFCQNNIKPEISCGRLYTLKVILLSLTTLSKTFQRGAIKFSQIIPNTGKIKSKLKWPFERKNDLLTLLIGKIDKKLQYCSLVIDKHTEKKIKNMTER